MNIAFINPLFFRFVNHEPSLTGSPEWHKTGGKSDELSPREIIGSSLVERAKKSFEVGVGHLFKVNTTGESG